MQRIKLEFIVRQKIIEYSIMYFNDKMNKKMEKKWIYILMLGNIVYNNKNF